MTMAYMYLELKNAVHVNHLVIFTMAIMFEKTKFGKIATVTAHVIYMLLLNNSSKYIIITSYFHSKPKFDKLFFESQKCRTVNTQNVFFDTKGLKYLHNDS